MQAKTPKQIVAEKFGSRAQLVDAITKILGSDGTERQKLMGTTNKKLLRIHETAQVAQNKFGGKAGLIKAIADLKFKDGKASSAWTQKMEGFTVKRLLEVHRQSR